MKQHFLFFLFWALRLIGASAQNNFTSPQQALNQLDSIHKTTVATATPPELNQALTAIDVIEKYFKKTQYDSGLAVCAFNKAEIFWYLGDIQKGIHLLENGLQSCEKKLPKNALVLGKMYYSIGFFQDEIGQQQTAFESIQKALAIFETRQAWVDCVDAYVALAQISYKMDAYNFETVEDFLNRGNAIAQKHLQPDELVWGYLYQTMAAIAFKKGDFDRGLTISQKNLELELNKKQVDSVMVATYYINIANLLEQKQDYDQAEIYAKSALLWYNSLQQPYHQMVCLRLLAEMSAARGDSILAGTYARQMKHQIDQTAWTPEEQLSQNIFKHFLMAHYFKYINKTDSLIAFYERELPDIEKFGLQPTTAYGHYADALIKMGEWEKAREVYLKILPKVKARYNGKGTPVATALRHLVQIAKQQEKWTTALDYCDQAIAALSPSSNGQDLTIFDPSKLLDKPVAASILADRAYVLNKLNRIDSAFQDIQLALSLATELRDKYTSDRSKQLSSSQMRQWFEWGSEIVWQQQLRAKLSGKSAKVPLETFFQYIEQSKSALLSEHLAKFRNRSKSKTSGIPTELLRREEQLLVDVAFYEERVHQAVLKRDTASERISQKILLQKKQAIQTLEDSLRAIYPSYKSWKHGRESIVNVRDVQKNLDVETVIIEYFFAEKLLYVLYISHNEFNVKMVSDSIRKQVVKNVQNFVREITNIHGANQHPQQSFAAWAKRGSFLYEHLLDNPAIAGKKRLIIVPDGILHYLPFEILPNKWVDTTKATWESAPYLLRQATVQYQYSSSLMMQVNQRIPNTINGWMFAMASEYGLGINWADLTPAVQRERTPQELAIHQTAIPLPGAKIEVDWLKNNFKGTFLFSKNANEAAIKQNTKPFSILHLAVHGMVNTYNPSLSGLILSEDLDTLEDNILYAYEIEHLQGQQYNLVVLSACETGLGKYERGEGVVSVGRAFMYSGVPSIVMTLWPLNDQTSVQIIQNFYRYLDAEFTKDEAMRKSKLDYLNNNQGYAAHPFFWASYIVIGNMRSIPVEVPTDAWYRIGLFVASGLLMIIGLYYSGKKLARTKARAARRAKGKSKPTSGA